MQKLRVENGFKSTSITVYFFPFDKTINKQLIKN